MRKVQISDDDIVAAAPTERAARSAKAAHYEAQSARAHALTKDANAANNETVSRGAHEAARDAHLECAKAHHAEAMRPR